jgi:hypothetical protein
MKNKRRTHEEVTEAFLLFLKDIQAHYVAGNKKSYVVFPEKHNLSHSTLELLRNSVILTLNRV